jgi:hypothetical protein
MHSVKNDGYPPADTPVLVYFEDPAIDPEIDYVDVCPEYGNEFFANFGDDVVFLEEIPKHPAKHI